MENGPVTGALASLLMATAGDVVSASTQLSCVDRQPVFELDGVAVGLEGAEGAALPERGPGGAPADGPAARAAGGPGVSFRRS